MSQRHKVWLTLLGIIILALLAGLVDYPNGPDISIGSFRKELKVHLGLDLQGGAQLTYEADLSDIPSDDQSSALEGTRDVIERRVNTFGVSEPVVQTSTLGESKRVIIELPGVTDVKEAIARIGETPLLEFREQATAQEQEPLTTEEQQLLTQTNNEARAKAEQALLRLGAGEDFATVANEISEDPGNTPSEGTQLGGDLGLRDPNEYVPEFRDALLNIKDGETSGIVESAFGFHILRREETKEEILEGGERVLQVRARHILLQTLSESDLRPTADYVATSLSGQHLKRATVVFDPNTGAPQVSLTFNDDGRKLFAEITKRNVDKVVAIYLDGVPISTPTVQTEITTGEAVITGSFQLPEAKSLAANLNAGALPVPIRLLSQQTVGATLGQASVERSLVAGLLGIVLVALFMILYYRLPGLLSVVALGVYSLLVFAIFKLWPVTLTLAGVAGFLLSVGMAVDANILIFERMREELRRGKSPHAAVEEGFSRAWLSIRDSNVSSLITCVILAWLGTSLVQGFAITLAIGILVSMFSAITVTRTILRLLLGRWAERHLSLLGAHPEVATETKKS